MGQIPAIPTQYAGVNFRSLLEAKWAAFFDQLGWHWQYEPFELRGWIPDFLLIGARQEVLVEVKPYSSLQEFLDNKVVLEIEKAISGTAKAGTEVLLLGSTIFESSKYFSGPAIGWLGECEQKDSSKYWYENAVMNASGRYGFFHAMGSYADRITGEHDGDHHLKIPSYDTVLALWREASNLTQWKSKRKTA